MSEFRERVLNWIYSMQIGASSFRMNHGADGTIFTSCFALFIFDLFRQVDAWTQGERDKWIDYIDSFQDKDTGYFVPTDFAGDLNAKPVQQLTCFCLSALDILGSSPRYRFSFINQWPLPQDIHVYLQVLGCFKGKPMTGNMAMFFGDILDTSI